jgi:hypothetical protein
MILFWIIRRNDCDELMMMTTMWLSCYGKRNDPGWLDQESRNCFRSLQVIVNNLRYLRYKRELC